MKFVYSTRWFNRSSFLGLCKLAFDYGCNGIEINDFYKERLSHPDSIFRSGKTADAKRKLINRELSVSAITLPQELENEEVTEPLLLSYVNAAVTAGSEYVIVHTKGEFETKKIAEKLSPLIKAAQKNEVTVLVETSGVYANTEKLIELFSVLEAVNVGAVWNIRETFFRGSESAEQTIKILGAYIRYVRLGDELDGKKVLLGEGTLPVADFLSALRSLNYESFVSIEPNDDIFDPDIVFTHFLGFMNRENGEKSGTKPLYYNRNGTGTYPWKKYEVIDKTFSQVLDTVVSQYPDQYAFRYTTLEYTRTYSQFKRDVDEVAAALISLGVKPGYHVAIWATNVPQWFLTFWATVKIGAVLVTVNTAYKSHEAEYLLRQSDTHTLVMIESCKESDYKGIMNELCPELEKTEPGSPLYAKKLPFLRNIITVGFRMKGALTWEEMTQRASLVPLEEVNRLASLVKPDDVANMQYTSGTTGFPKGVMLTHRNIINNGKIIGDRMDLSSAERMMIQVPMFHCFGMVLSMTSMMTHAGTLSPLPYFSPKSSLACINAERITCFNGVPTMFLAMMGHEDFVKTDFSHIRTGIMAGANCPPELMKKAADEMNMKEILSVYGQTESSPGCTMGEVNEPLELRVQTVGSAFPGVECRIIDPETGKELPDGENGEFVTRGYHVMKGYYKMPKATASAIDQNGWLHTGDICCRTKEGYYRVTGRLKDMIIRGGENLYPREIEEFYLTHPAVRDVQVVGVPDKTYGEEACAWIICEPGSTLTAEQMRDYGNAHMARHKVPKYFMFVAEFPMNAAGKILKYKMVEQSKAELGL